MHRTRLGLQIPNFTYPGVAPDQLFERVAAQAVAAEQSGFDTVFVMDHFFQLPMLGRPDQEMFESYTLLAALAARTRTVRLGTLVTGVTYREPALLAKAVTALDVISGGRALLGIGAAWFEAGARRARLRVPAAARALRAPRRRAGDLPGHVHPARRRPTPARTTRVTDAFNSPAPINGDIPIMIGGQGEKKTFRLAAQYAQELNTTALFDDLPRKLDALQGHLDDLGRARRTSPSRRSARSSLAPTHDGALGKMRAPARRPRRRRRRAAGRRAGEQAAARPLRVGRPGRGRRAGAGADRRSGSTASSSTSSPTPTTPTPSPSPARR